MQKPILNIKRKKRKSKKKALYVPVDIRRIADPDFSFGRVTWKPLSEMTPEEYDKFKKGTCQSILNRKKRSPRFNKYQNRRISETNYRLYQGKTKVCTHCERELGITFFDKQRDKRHSLQYRRPYCIDCRKKKNREAYLKRKEQNDS